jgi:hypothetical protein
LEILDDVEVLGMKWSGDLVFFVLLLRFFCFLILVSDVSVTSRFTDTLIFSEDMNWFEGLVFLGSLVSWTSAQARAGGVCCLWTIFLVSSLEA